MRVEVLEASLREEGSALPSQLSFGTKDPEQRSGASQFRVSPARAAATRGGRSGGFN